MEADLAGTKLPSSPALLCHQKCVVIYLRLNVIEQSHAAKVLALNAMSQSTLATKQEVCGLFILIFFLNQAQQVTTEAIEDFARCPWWLVKMQRVTLIHDVIKTDTDQVKGAVFSLNSVYNYVSF